MSFDLDDPLAGILSDDSDDSFFNDDVLGKKKTQKKKDTPIAEKKKALFDLDRESEDLDKSKITRNIQDSTLKSLPNLEEDNTAKKTPIDFDKNTTVPSPTPFKRTISKESISKPAEIDTMTNIAAAKKSPAKSRFSTSADKIFDEFSVEPPVEPKKETPKPLEKGKSSQSLLDDILGGSSTKTGSSVQVARPATAAKNQDYNFESILGKTEPKQTLSSSVKTAAVKQNVVVDIKSKPEAAQVKKSKTSEDWLGIFQDKNKNEDVENDPDMPSWLGGGDSKKKEVIVTETKKKSEKEEKKSEKDRENTVGKIEMKPETKLSSTLDELTKVVPHSNLLQSSNDDITAEGAAMYLQQQESQLMVALQLKAQEEKVAALQMRHKESQRVQKEAEMAHHAQLDAMLRRQAEHRKQMQAIIAAHQDRITERIRALLGTPMNENGVHGDFHDELEDATKDHNETPHMKEMKQLLQLIKSLQENHDKEIDLMDTSYRRQLAFLEVSSNQAEERMKQESDKLVKFYMEKITWLEEHHQLYKKLSEDNLNSLTERQKVESEMLRLQHLENIKILQEHHVALIENIKNASKQEKVLIQDSAGFSSDLHELVNDVKENKTQCQQLVERVEAIVEGARRDGDKSLHSREMQITDMIQQLKRERESFEVEKSESRDMAKTLETRLKQMTAMIEEETSSLKQKKMEFEFEKATFAKQTEFAKNVLKKQDEEIKMLKDEIQKEYQEKITKIEEEKAKAIRDSSTMAKEKASIQNIKQELEKMKSELEAQLEQVTEERSNLNVEKQQMHMEEQRKLAKSRDLDLLAKSAIEKQSHADKKYAEAELLLRRYEERIRRIQEHVVSLNLREKQIAKEKVSLSRERLSLHNERKQIESRQQCSLCKSSQNIPQYNIETSYAPPDNFLNIPVSRDYGSASMNTATYAIEQEMTQLLSRNFNLSDSAGIANMNSYDTKYGKDKDTVIQDGNFTSFQETRPNTGAFKDYMDPKFMMMRLDVQQVIQNLEQSKREDGERTETQQEHSQE